MGHQRLGRLPAHRLLPDIVRYLVAGGTPTEDLVQQITEIGQDSLAHGLKEPVFIHAIWLLVRIPQAMASPDFVSELKKLDVTLTPSADLPEVLVAFDDALERVQRRSQSGGSDLGEIARHAAISAMAEATRLPTLWDPNANDVRASVAILRGPERFGEMAQRFFAGFVERVIHYFIDRNLHEMVGPRRVNRSLNEVTDFNAGIRRHCDEASLIMRVFAKDWLGKNHYKLRNQITPITVAGFARHTVKKMRIELDRRRGNLAVISH